MGCILYEMLIGEEVFKGETPTQAIIRELKEETGCIAGEVILLKEVIPDTGRLENKLWAFYVSNVEVKDIPSPDNNEGIEVQLVSHEELFEMMLFVISL